MCPLPDVPPARRTALVVGLFGACLLALPSSLRAQADTDKIDITGRQNLTLGSGARAYGMGGAFLARPDDATAASWNPAGLSYLRQPEITLAGAFNSFNSERGLDHDSFEGKAIDFAAFTWPLALGGVRGAVQVSYQRAISFDGRRSIAIYDRPEQPNLATLKETWSGSSDGGFDVVAFGSGLRLTRRLRAGVTVNRWASGYDQRMTRTLYTEFQSRPVRQFDLYFRPGGWSANAGVIYSPVESLNLGAVYKTSVDATTRVDRARRDYWGTLEQIDEVTENSYSSESVGLRLPSSFGFGVSWRPTDVLTLSADYTRSAWSDATITNWFEVRVRPRDGADGKPAPAPAPVLLDPAFYPTLTDLDEEDVAKRQVDAEQIRLGLEYVLIKGRLKVPLRAGYFSDRQIKPNPDGKGPRYDGLTAGIGLVLGPMLLDVAYVHEFGEFSTPADLAGAGFDPAPGAALPPNPRYSVTANRVFTSIIYRFDTRR